MSQSKVIYYSDKSETDDGDMIMADTPSNYDLQNCRLDCSKMPELKSALTQGRNLGSLNTTQE